MERVIGSVNGTTLSEMKSLNDLGIALNTTKLGSDLANDITSSELDDLSDPKLDSLSGLANETTTTELDSLSNLATYDTNSPNSDCLRDLASDTTSTKLNCLRDLASDTTSTMLDCLRDLASDTTSTKLDSSSDLASDTTSTKLDCLRDLASDTTSTKLDSTSDLASDTTSTKLDSSSDLASDTTSTKLDILGDLGDLVTSTKLDSVCDLTNDTTATKSDSLGDLANDTNSPKLISLRSSANDDKSTELDSLSDVAIDTTIDIADTRTFSSKDKSQVNLVCNNSNTVEERQDTTDHHIKSLSSDPVQLEEDTRHIRWKFGDANSVRRLLVNMVRLKDNENEEEGGESESDESEKNESEEDESDATSSDRGVFLPTSTGILHPSEDGKDYSIGDGRGQYDIVRRLAKAGTAVVNLCQDNISSRYIARKEIQKTKFREVEVEVLLRLTSDAEPCSHVPTLYAVHFDKACVHLWMEFIDYTWVRYRVGYEEDGVMLLKQVLTALQSLHQREIYHLDIKPQNLGLDPRGRVALLDFGSARIGAGTKDRGVGVMTPEYSCPEVCRCKAVAELVSLPYPGRADVWSAACCIIYVMGGRHIWYDVSDNGKDMYKRYHEVPVRVAECTTAEVMRYLPVGYHQGFLGVLLRHMLDTDPVNRCTATQALAYLACFRSPHSLVNNAIWQDYLSSFSNRPTKEHVEPIVDEDEDCDEAELLMNADTQ